MAASILTLAFQKQPRDNFYVFDNEYNGFLYGCFESL